MPFDNVLTPYWQNFLPPFLPGRSNGLGVSRTRGPCKGYAASTPAAHAKPPPVCTRGARVGCTPWLGRLLLKNGTSDLAAGLSVVLQYQWYVHRPGRPEAYRVHCQTAKPVPATLVITQVSLPCMSIWSLTGCIAHPQSKLRSRRPGPKAMDTQADPPV